MVDEEEEESLTVADPRPPPLPPLPPLLEPLLLRCDGGNDDDVCKNGGIEEGG